MVFCGTALEWKATARERLVWRGMSLLEVALRSGTGEGIVARVLREVIEDGSPELEALEPWVRGEFHRGYPPDLAGAGRALSAYDGRELTPDVDVPCAVVVTTTDQLVRPEKQYELADALDAETFPLQGDHFAPFNRGPAFAKAIRTRRRPGDGRARGSGLAMRPSSPWPPPPRQRSCRPDSVAPGRSGSGWR